jgi:acetamidase/formamidase
VPDAFGGNLDIPDLRAGATLYLTANVDEAMVYVGDGHFAQGDGELAGTAVEGALRTELIFENCGPSDDVHWPRLETDAEIAVIGCARPLEDAARIAAHGLVHWVGRICGLELADAHQLVSQNCRLRIGNLVNPLYTIAAFIDKKRLPDASRIFAGAHDALRTAARQRR